MTSCELHFETDGPTDADVLLLGGSLGTTLAMWEPQVAALADSVRMVRFDHRGHGGTPAPAGRYAIDELGRDVVSLLDRLEISRVSYCGLSLGGMVGMWLAANEPERIERLILICTSAHLLGLGYGERAASVREADTVEIVADVVLARWFTREFTAQHPALVARYRQMLVSTSVAGYAGCCEAVDALDLRSELSRIEAPSLIIAGARDPATPPEHAETIARGIHGARLEVLDDAAHLASVQQPAATGALIREHLEL